MADAHAERRLAAILAADVVGYARLVEQDEAATLGAGGDGLGEASGLASACERAAACSGLAL
jgi:class 3 adenylate cyclase